MTLEINSTLNNRYVIHGILAQGGMGAIYQAYDQSLNIQVAIKENLVFSDESTRQFRREATILAGLRHPNLPRVTDHFVIPNYGQYLAMDFIEGEDLRERVNRMGVLSGEEAIMIGASICDALTYLHSRKPPIIHRDIKPGNIKITPDGQIFLVDFGLAKVDQGGQTTIGAQSLTPGYAPPEQYGQGTDTRSDIYSLGATLYGVITGKVPEDGLARAMDSASLTSIRKYNPKVTEALNLVIEKAMSVNLGDRQQTALELKRDLLGASDSAREFTKNPPVDIKAPLAQQTSRVASVARPATQSQREIRDPALVAPQAQSIPQKKKSPIIPLAIVGVLLLCVLVVGGVIIFKLGSSSSTITTIPKNPVLANNGGSTSTAVATVATVVQSATQQESTPVPVPLSPSLEPSPTDTIVPTLAGGGSGQIAFASDRSGTPQIWIMNSDGGDVKQITNLPDGACQPDWSPDGKQLIVTSPCRAKQDSYKGSSLFFINSDGTGLFPLPSVPGGDFDPAWSPDGGRIAFSSFREGNFSGIYIYDINLKTTQKLFKTKANDRRPAWSSDGAWFLFESTRTNQQQIWLAGSDGSNPKALSGQDTSSFMPDWAPDGKVVVYSQGSSLPWLVAKQLEAGTPEFRISDVRPALNAEYSKDGYWLVFEGLSDGDTELFRMMTNGSSVTRLTNQKGKDFDPTWRP
jgi:eukaryotic-like serine/threonine-protein kinase